MKYLFLCYLFFIFSSLIQPLNAQKKKKKDEAELFYLLKKDWSAASNWASADYFMQIVKDNDSVHICRYYSKFGPMVKQESFSDTSLTIPNGLFCWYNIDGFLDSSGYVKQGHKEGNWSYYRKDKNYLTLRYQNGKLIEKRDVDADVYMDSTGAQLSLKEKLIKDSLSRDSLMLARDSLKAIQEEAKFKGNWSDYISKNLKTPERLENVLGTGKYVVIVSFLVNKEGKIEQVSLIKSCEWSADSEVLHVFKNAPDWIPAHQNGRPVIYRQKQALTFVVNEY